MCRHLWVSVRNALSLKETKQVVFKQQTFKGYQVFLVYVTLSRTLNTWYINCNFVIGQCKTKLHLQEGVNLDTNTYHSVNRNM